VSRKVEEGNKEEEIEAPVTKNKTDNLDNLQAQKI